MLESNIKIPDQNPQSLPTPPPPTPISPSRPETVPILNGDSLPPPPTNSSVDNGVRNSSVDSQKKNGLVGVIQLPDGGGFALFNVNNITERVAVGSAIASTGWTLGGIYDNEVIINRNSQSLSLRVGESFLTFKAIFCLNERISTSPKLHKTSPQFSLDLNFRF